MGQERETINGLIENPILVADEQLINLNSPWGLASLHSPGGVMLRCLGGWPNIAGPNLD